MNTIKKEDLESVHALTIPEGKVAKIRLNGEIIWEKYVEPTLPDEYVACRAIGQYQSGTTTTGNIAYIDTGIAFDTGATIYLDYEAAPSTSLYVFGATENSGALRCILTDNSSNAIFYGSTGSAYYSISLNPRTSELGSWKLTMKQGSMVAENLITGEKKSSTSQGTYTMTNTIHLFGQNYNGANRQAARLIFKAFKYYDKDNKLISNLVPCARKSDGVAGFYDLIRNVFLTNASTTSTYSLGGIVLDKSESGATYTNLVPTSTDTDGTIFNGTGYKDGHRVRSGGLVAASTHATCTGRIPYKKGDKLYIYPAFCGLNSDNAINFLDANNNVLGQVCPSGAYYGFCNSKFLPKNEGICSVLDISNISVTNIDKVAYVRVTNGLNSKRGLISSGSELIVTVNEPIV